MTTIQKIYRETADISNTLSGRSSNIQDNISSKATHQSNDMNTKLKDKITNLVKHLDKDVERPKTRTRKSEVDLKDNSKNMLIINNHFECDVQLNKNNYQSSINNYVSPKPRLEQMTDKYFGSKSNNAKNYNFNASDPNPNSHSNINNYISLTSKFQSKEKSVGRSEDIGSGMDNFKKKLNRSNNFSGIKMLILETSIESVFKLEDIKSLANSLKYMSEDSIRKLNPL
jgi:hypothetical protein